MSNLWIIPALVAGMFCALLAKYLATRGLIWLGIPLTRTVETGRVDGKPVFQQRQTPVFLVVDAIAYLGGLAGGVLGVKYLFQSWWGE